MPAAVVLDLRTLPRGSSGTEVARCPSLQAAREEARRIAGGRAAVPGAAPYDEQACRLQVKPVYG